MQKRLPLKSLRVVRKTDFSAVMCFSTAQSSRFIFASMPVEYSSTKMTGGLPESQLAQSVFLGYFGIATDAPINAIARANFL